MPTGNKGLINHISNSKKQLTNVQCHACKSFGHKSSECNLVGRVLAIMDLKERNPTICKRILTTHTEKNTPEKRLAIIKTLQTINVLDDNIPAESHLVDTEADDTITNTINATNCTIQDDDILNHTETNMSE